MRNSTTALSLLLTLFMAAPVLAAQPEQSVPAAAVAPAVWKPKASERLVKLPPSYLKKSLEHDFAQSPLADAIGQVDEDIDLKTQTLGDLQTAIEQADGELAVELRHQFLAQKREYIQLMAKKSDLNRRHLQTRQKILARLLEKVDGRRGPVTPARAQLVAAQQNARKRFAKSRDQVDMLALATPAAPESRYARDYAKNLSAIEKLSEAINHHPMNGSPTAGAATKQDQLRQMLADAQAGLALLDQERTMLGYMAKLVALDAMALSEQVMDAELADSGLPRTDTPAQAVNFFVNK